MIRWFASLPIVLVFILPLIASLALILPDFTNIRAFADLFSHPQFPGALQLSLFTGIAATVLSLLCAIGMIAGPRTVPAARSGAFMSMPHLALAIGLGFLIMPSGLLARIIATVFTGWTTPPPWVTAQDPHGLALIAALVLKETPFLVWAFLSLLNRDDLKGLFDSQIRSARSLGHGSRSIWLRVLLPQLLPRIVWPLVAVLVYGTTVVDMALVIGPTQPATLATIIWADLNDGEVANNARGAAGVLVLGAMNLCLLVVVWCLLALGRPLAHILHSGHPRPENVPNAVSVLLRGFWTGLYSLIGVLLVVMSFAGYWPFPSLTPHVLALSAWSRLAVSPGPLVASLVLAMATTLAAICAAILWMEHQPERHDRIVLTACGIALCFPSLVIALGQYRLFLLFGITGTALALFMAHVLPVSAYVFVMLHGPYRAYDRRWSATAAGLLATRTGFLARIKWPMLKTPLLAAAAVGFAVSISQYVPAQLAAAGRYSTLPMEAVTLSSSGNRSLIATYALALTVLPLIAFLLASRLGRPRWRLR